MLEVLRLILKTIADFIAMLFTIDLGFASLGSLLCIIAFFFPLVLFVINFLKIRMRDDN